MWHLACGAAPLSHLRHPVLLRGCMQPCHAAVAGRSTSSSKNSKCLKSTKRSCVGAFSSVPACPCPMHVCGMSRARHWKQRSQELGFRQRCSSDVEKKIKAAKQESCLGSALKFWSPYCSSNTSACQKATSSWPGACILLSNPHLFPSPFYLTTRNSFVLTQDRLLLSMSPDSAPVGSA